MELCFSHIIPVKSGRVFRPFGLTTPDSFFSLGQLNSIRLPCRSAELTSLMNFKHDWYNTRFNQASIEKKKLVSNVRHIILILPPRDLGKFPQMGCYNARYMCQHFNRVPSCPSRALGTLFSWSNIASSTTYAMASTTTVLHTIIHIDNLQ